VKIVIEGVEYPFVHPAEAKPSQLIALQRQSGLTFEDIECGMQHLQQIAKDDTNLEPYQFMAKVVSQIDILLSVAALVFLARWAAGEKLTFEEATDIPFTSVQFAPEPGDEVQPAGPEGSALPASGPGGNRAARRASTPSRSKSLKVPSPSA